MQKQMHYAIIVETQSGQRYQAFTWVGDPKAGVARAAKEAILFERDYKTIWADPVGSW